MDGMVDMGEYRPGQLLPVQHNPDNPYEETWFYGADLGHGGRSASSGFAYTPTSREYRGRRSLQDYQLQGNTSPTTLLMGTHKAGTRFEDILGPGKAINQEYALMSQYGGKLHSLSAVKTYERGVDWTTQYIKSGNVEANPWGEGADAREAKLAFERQFMANEEAALRDFTQLQIREYGAAYAMAGDIRRQKIGQTTPGQDAGDPEDVYTEAQQYAYIAPKQDLSEIEKYKLWRYNIRNIQTDKAIGSGFDEAYNPAGLTDIDKYAPGAFVQEAPEFAGMRIADRASRQSGKEITKTAPTKGVQL